MEDGAEEVDLMANVGFRLSGMEREYADDIGGVVRAAGRIPVKIMLELPLLNAQQKVRAVALSIDAGIAYLKNASGGAVGVATPEQIRFLRELAPPNIRIKASGGIKTAQQVRALLAAGADLVGTSSAVEIIQEVAGGRLRVRGRSCAILNASGRKAIESKQPRSPQWLTNLPRIRRSPQYEELARNPTNRRSRMVTCSCVLPEGS